MVAGRAAGARFAARLHYRARSAGRARRGWRAYRNLRTVPLNSLNFLLHVPFDCLWGPPIAAAAAAALLDCSATLRYVAVSDSDDSDGSDAAGYTRGKYFHGPAYLPMHCMAPVVVVDAVGNFAAAAAHRRKPVLDMRFAAGYTFRLLRFLLRSSVLVPLPSAAVPSILHTLPYPAVVAVHYRPSLPLGRIHFLHSYYHYHYHYHCRCHFQDSPSLPS